MAAALSAEALLEPLVPPTTGQQSASPLLPLLGYAHTHSHTYTYIYTHPRAADTEAAFEAGADASASDVRVFLPDYQGWWAPLTHLFYSPTGRCLAGAHPQATSEEIESYYCPSCLSYLAEAEAAAAGHRCPRCFDCPRCPPGGAAALAVVPAVSAAAGGSASGAGGWELRCAFCGWGSAAALGLVEEDPEYLGMTLSVAERESSEEGRVRPRVCVCVRQACVFCGSPIMLTHQTHTPPYPFFLAKHSSSTSWGRCGGRRRSARGSGS